MKICIDENKCIGCGSCVSLTDSKIFDFNDDGKAYVKVKEVKDEDKENTLTALEYCPTGAISEKADDNNEEGGTSNKKDTNKNAKKNANKDTNTNNKK